MDSEYNNKTAADVFNSLAELYCARFMDLSIYNDSYDSFLTIIKKKNAHVIELGCGPGNITKYLLGKRPDLKILATDLAPKMVEIAGTVNPQAECNVFDCRDLATLSQTFDAVVTGFCVPYLSQEEVSKLIRDCNDILNAEGVVYLSAIEGDYACSSSQTGSSGDNIYVHYYSEEFISGCFSLSGFKVVDVMRKEYVRSDSKKEVHLIFLAAKS